MKDWLDTLKAGDNWDIVLRDRFENFTVKHLTVDRRTPTQIILTDGSRWNSTTGRRIGSKAYFDDLRQPASKERIAEALGAIRRQIVLQKVRRLNWDIYKLSILEQVLNLTLLEDKK